MHLAWVSVNTSGQLPPIIEEIIGDEPFPVNDFLASTANLVENITMFALFRSFGNCNDSADDAKANGRAS
jgi:hypothetical protein